MIFLNPIALLLLILVPPAIIFIVWRLRTHQRTLHELGDWVLIRQLLTRYDLRWRYWQSGLWLMTLVLLIIAAARPAWGVNVDVVELQGVSVMIVLDVSNSMSSQDALPSRLAQAKFALHELFAGLAGNEVGLILFAGRAFVQFPLTTDVNTAQTFLKAVSTHSITQQGTAVEVALQLALDTFDEQSSTIPVIILATDGEDHEGDIDRVVDVAVQRGVIIHTLGYGSSDGVPIPVLSDDGEPVGYKVGSTGDAVLSRLDEDTLRTIAERTGGLYQRSTASSTEINNLLQIIRQMETGLLDNRLETRAIERFGIFVLVAILTLSFEILASPRRNSNSQ